MLGIHVPWNLDDKYEAYEFVRKAGYRTPRYERRASQKEAFEVGSNFGRRFLLKQPNRHSAKGIYLLEKTPSGKYIDLLSMRIIDPNNIKPDGPDPEYWLAEECVESEVNGREIPFDYKIYCIHGVPVLIIQIDRNTSPPHISVFDGGFFPLNFEEHYSLDKKRWLKGSHVIPFHAGSLLGMAGALAKKLKTSFVSVDCYCTPTGPVFGEFTFAPGAPDVKMITYKEDVLNSLDRSLLERDFSALSGIDLDIDALHADCESNSICFPESLREIYGYISSRGALGDVRYARLLTEYPVKNKMQEHFRLASRLIGIQNGDKEQLFFVWKSIKNKLGYLKSTSNLIKFEDNALLFHSERSGGNYWHATKSAELRLWRNDKDAVDELREMARKGYIPADKALVENSEVISKVLKN